MGLCPPMSPIVLQLGGLLCSVSLLQVAHLQGSILWRGQSSPAVLNSCLSAFGVSMGRAAPMWVQKWGEAAGRALGVRVQAWPMCDGSGPHLPRGAASLGSGRRGAVSGGSRAPEPRRCKGRGGAWPRRSRAWPSAAAAGSKAARGSAGVLGHPWAPLRLRALGKARGGGVWGGF